MVVQMRRAAEQRQLPPGRSPGARPARPDRPTRRGRRPPTAHCPATGRRACGTAVRSPAYRCKGVDDLLDGRDVAARRVRRDRPDLRRYGSRRRSREPGAPRSGRGGVVQRQRPDETRPIGAPKVVRAGAVQGGQLAAESRRRRTATARPASIHSIASSPAGRPAPPGRRPPRPIAASSDRPPRPRRSPGGGDPAGQVLVKIEVPSSRVRRDAVHTPPPATGVSRMR